MASNNKQSNEQKITTLEPEIKKRFKDFDDEQTGMAMYELGQSLNLPAKFDYGSGVISKEQFNTAIQYLDSVANGEAESFADARAKLEVAIEHREPSDIQGQASDSSMDQVRAIAEVAAPSAINMARKLAAQGVVNEEDALLTFDLIQAHTFKQIVESGEFSSMVQEVQQTKQQGPVGNGRRLQQQAQKYLNQQNSQALPESSSASS